MQHQNREHNVKYLKWELEYPPSEFTTMLHVRNALLDSRIGFEHNNKAMTMRPPCIHNTWCRCRQIYSDVFDIKSNMMNTTSLSVK